MTEIFNLYTLCRCCHRDGSFKSLQLSYSYDNRIEVYSTMLKETLDVAISPPKVEASYAICDYCIQNLRDATHFKHQVLECEQKFKEYCKNEQALTVKVEIEYDSSNDNDLGINSGTQYEYDQEDEKIKDEKCDNIIITSVKSIISKADGVADFQDNIDEKYDVKIKEENEEVPPNTIEQSMPIESVKTEEPKTLVSGRILKRNGVKAIVRRRKKTNGNVDSELESHVKTDDGDKYICKMCNKTYKVLKLLRKHILSQHKDAYTCKVCSLQCVGRFHYLRHSKTHAVALFKCNLCLKSFTKKSSLHHHLNNHTRTEKFQCDKCHKVFGNKQTLKKHILWHYGAHKKCMCDVCGHAFNDVTNLNKHIRSVHEKQRPFKCHLCPKTFTANKNLKEHSYFHTGEMPYKCDVCSDKFVFSWKLRHHQFKYHPKPNDGQVMKLYTCKICKLELNTRGKFMSHLKTHVGQKDYQCHLCTKDFTCKYSLNRHIIAHSGVKPYGCDMCDKKYTQPSQLWRHKKRIHDPDSLAYPGRVVERIKCDLCNKSFKNIAKHMVSHKSRPHVCEICLKSYPERNTLNRHILVVHQGVRHPCTMCEKKYTKWEGLKRHMSKVHKFELKKEVEES